MLILQWCAAVWKHWGALISGGAATVLVYAVDYYHPTGLPKSLPWLGLGAGLVVASYKAWRDEHAAARRSEVRIEPLREDNGDLIILNASAWAAYDVRLEDFSFGGFQSLPELTKPLKQLVPGREGKLPLTPVRTPDGTILVEGYILYNCILDWERSLGKEKEGLAVTIYIRYRDTGLIEYRTVCELRRNVATSPGGIDVETVKHERLGRKPRRG